jgi:integrase
MKVRERIYKGGRVAWQLDLGVVDGKRVQRAYETKEAAMTAMRDARAARRKHGDQAVMLSAGEVAEVVRLKEELDRCGATLGEAVRFFLATSGRVKLQADAVLMPELVRRFIKSRTGAGCGKLYTNQLNVSLGSLGRMYSMLPASQLTRDAVERWLAGNGWAAKTRNNYLGDARALCAWAVEAGWMLVNPCLKIVKAREVREEIATLTLAQCGRLLKAAVEDREVCGYVVLSLFCGIRRAEVGRMSWDSVDIEHGTVIVAEKHAKATRARSRRVVDLHGNAIAWLRACYGASLPTGNICQGRFGDVWLAFRKPVIGVDEWPHNAMRHTFASMHYAMWENEAKLQVQMGHESAAMLHRNYRAIKTRTEAAAFWDLRPDKPAKGTPK